MTLKFHYFSPYELEHLHAMSYLQLITGVVSKRLKRDKKNVSLFWVLREGNFFLLQPPTPCRTKKKTFIIFIYF